MRTLTASRSAGGPTLPAAYTIAHDAKPVSGESFDVLEVHASLPKQAFGGDCITTANPTLFS